LSWWGDSSRIVSELPLRLEARLLQSRHVLATVEA